MEEKRQIIGLFGVLLLAMLLGGLQHRTLLGLGAALAMLVLLVVLSALGRRRAARDPEFAARVAKVKAEMEAKVWGGGDFRRAPDRQRAARSSRIVFRPSLDG